MESFIPSRSVFEKLLTQQGGSIDRYIFHQSGHGLGNFFAKIFRFVKPLASAAIKVARPHLESIGKNLVDAGSKAAVSEIEKFRDKAHQKINNKRKKDNLDV